MGARCASTWRQVTGCRVRIAPGAWCPGGLAPGPIWVLLGLGSWGHLRWFPGTTRQRRTACVPLQGGGGYVNQQER